MAKHAKRVAYSLSSR